jgi:hypothetical protein
MNGLGVNTVNYGVSIRTVALTRSGKRFMCPNPRCHLCGLAADADINGARVIARFGASFMRPSGPWLSCTLDHRASENTRLDALGTSPRTLAVGT